MADTPNNQTRIARQVGRPVCKATLFRQPYIRAPWLSTRSYLGTRGRNANPRIFKKAGHFIKKLASCQFLALERPGSVGFRLHRPDCKACARTNRAPSLQSAENLWITRFGGVPFHLVAHSGQPLAERLMRPRIFVPNTRSPTLRPSDMRSAPGSDSPLLVVA